MSEENNVSKLINKVQENISDFFENINDYIELTEAGEIIRRYFVMNAFDGALTMLGFVVGVFVSGYIDPKIILSAGMSASFAMGVSGFVGALITEKAERERKVKELEKAMFTELEGSIIEKASLMAVVLAALTDSFAPAMAALICASPFIFSEIGLLSPIVATFVSIIITLVLVFLLGMYLGKISGGGALIYGIYMLTAGLVVSLIVTITSIHFEGVNRIPLVIGDNEWMMK